MTSSFAQSCVSLCHHNIPNLDKHAITRLRGPLLTCSSIQTIGPVRQRGCL